MAAAAMEAREERSYAKGLRAYDAWRRMLLDEKIDSARQGDTGAYEQIKRILQNPIPFLK